VSDADTAISMAGTPGPAAGAATSGIAIDVSAATVDIKGVIGLPPVVHPASHLRPCHPPCQLQSNTICSNCIDRIISTMQTVLAGGPRTQKVIDAIRHRIEQRVLTPGSRLPSIRAMASSAGVSNATVVEAYARLEAEGMIRSRPGAGFFVTAPLAPLDLAGTPECREACPVWTLRHMHWATPSAHRPGAGWLPASWLADEPVRRMLRRMARQAPARDLTAYAPSQGSLALRTLFARRLFDEGVECGPDQVLITDSASHGIDLALRFLTEPGDHVLLDDPCYFNFHAMMLAHRLNRATVPWTADGPDLTVLAEILADPVRRPRVYLTTGGLHNPTGGTRSATVTRRIVQMCAAAGVAIIEDDVYGDFESRPSPRLVAFDGLDHVIRVGSFSKTLSGAVRCGWLAARAEWVAGLTDLRAATGIAGCRLSADLLLHLISDGSYKRHMEQVRTRLAQLMPTTLARFRSIGIEPQSNGVDGFYIWARLPGGMVATALAGKALDHDIVLAPGAIFSRTTDYDDHMRFNIAQMDETVWAFLAGETAR
jgi:DNA-binding transcriptional MocR family regulator